MRHALMFAGFAAIAVHAAGRTAAAAEAPAPQAQVMPYTVDCRAPRRLPSQHDVAEWAGQQNVAQVYATRQRLMADIGRACRNAGTESVRLTRDAQPANPGRPVARADTPHR
jgi:hypothetical protein